jgi:hypothetical protein
MGIDVLVPVLHRPHAAKPLAESLKVTKEPYRLIFICSAGDLTEIEACKAVGDVLVTDWGPGKADFAKKINWAFDQTDSEWIFQGADDIRFSAGWEQQALALAASKRRRVIGTNDLHNPLVKRGKHSTHTLFARSYIEEHGGTLDGTGRVFCELYDHQYVDSEFIEVAKRRSEWVFSRNSIVEHFHPHWGNAPDDHTYRKATRSSGPDRRLYMQRMGIERSHPSRRRHTRRPT